MEKNPSGKPPGSGLELDKLELPGHSSQEAVRELAADPEQEPALSSEPGYFGRRHLRLTLTAVITTLALLTVLAMYLKKQDLKISPLSLKRGALSDSYLRVGPITATIRDNEIIRLSLDIECRNDAAKERLAEKDSRIRDRIVSVITAPDTETLLRNQQYDAVRANIRKSLEKVYGESIGEVYFVELLTY